nr:hypothetical protein [Desulforhopalus singaporensis]
MQSAAAVGLPDSHAGEIPFLFVRLEEGVDLSPSEIIDPLKQLISERAAVPKEVFILDLILLTAIGKVFKSKLRWLAIETVYRRVLSGLGAQGVSLDIRVCDDPSYGSLATIALELAPESDDTVIRRQVTDLLGPYSIRYDLEFILV